MLVEAKTRLRELQSILWMAGLSVDIGAYIGTTLWPLPKSLDRIHVLLKELGILFWGPYIRDPYGSMLGAPDFQKLP